MSNGFRAKKLGMTQIYNTDGTITPVSVLEVLHHKILFHNTHLDFHCKIEDKYNHFPQVYL